MLDLRIDFLSLPKKEQVLCYYKHLQQGQQESKRMLFLQLFQKHRSEYLLYKELQLLIKIDELLVKQELFVDLRHDSFDLLKRQMLPRLSLHEVLVNNH